MKMKLRRRREEEGEPTLLALLPSSRPWLEPCPLPDLTLLLPSSFLPLPPPSPRQPATCHSSLSAATCRSSYPSPAVPLFPFLLHKITEAARYGIRRVALYSTCRPSLPVQLAGLAIAAPARRTLASSSNQVAATPLRF